MFLGHPFGSMSTESRQGLVSVAITLRPAAAEVGGCCVLKYLTSVLTPDSQKETPRTPFNICLTGM